VIAFRNSTSISAKPFGCFRCRSFPRLPKVTPQILTVRTLVRIVVIMVRAHLEFHTSGDGRNMQSEAIESGMTVREAGIALNLRSQSIYNLLRDDLLKGEKTADGVWILSRESVSRYAVRQRLRRAASRSALQRGAIDIAAGVHAGV
jgi:hypothetical protein